MTIEESLRQRIAAEAEQRRQEANNSLPEAWAGLVATGYGQRVLEDILFFYPPAALPQRLADLGRELRAKYVANGRSREPILAFLADLTIALRSFLPGWHLHTALYPEQVQAQAEAIAALALNLAQEDPETTKSFLAARQAQAGARFQAEAAADPQAEAARLVGRSLADYLDNMSAAITSSYLRRLAQARVAGEMPTELGNDYAAYLDYAMYLGASFVTSNPVLIGLAWEADPARWDPVVDAIIAAHPQADAHALARLMTMEVVFSNMRLLRPIFLLTGGRMGYVSLQVNPKEHNNTAAMVADAEAIYAELTRKLDGGVPNVVFKLPATQAGLAACRHLTGKGIGVNITVNFGLFQEVSFAQAIRQGHALVSYLTDMNGRLAFPVRDELLSKLPQLAALGIDEARCRCAAAWSGVAVIKRLHRLLTEEGYDLTRIRPLVASLRWYDGPLYASLPSPCPDVTETTGVAVITVFPNIRRNLDTTPGLPFAPNRITQPVPEDMLLILEHSEIFKQGYYLPGDVTHIPKRPIALEEEEITADWPPVRNTLAEFSKAYDRFVERIMARQAHRPSTRLAAAT